MENNKIDKYNASWKNWDKNNWQDAVSLTFLVIVGVTGLLFVMIPPKKEDKTQEYGMFTKYGSSDEERGYAYPENHYTIANPSSAKPDFVPAKVTIEGRMKVEYPIRVSIDNYDSQFRYYMDAGDGKVHVFLGRVKTYTFQQSGAYTLRVFAERKDKIRKEVFSEKIYIRPTSEEI